jgi:hypothetical protein
MYIHINISYIDLLLLALVGIPLGGRFSDIGYWKSGVGDISYTFPDDPQRAFLRYFFTSIWKFELKDISEDSLTLSHHIVEVVAN